MEMKHGNITENSGRTETDVDFEENKELVDSGELDSFDIVSLVGELCDEYDIEIGADEIVPENFNSVEAIWALMQRLQED